MDSLIRRDVFDLLDPFRRLIGAGTELEVAWPRVEEFQDGNTMVIRAELPGIDPEQDVELTVVNDTLQLRAQKREKSEHKDQRSYRSEIRYGSFARTLPLPEGTKDEDISASYADGVLEVRAPVRDQARQQTTRKIPITRTETGTTATGTADTATGTGTTA
jgi:HSP20 family protein